MLEIETVLQKLLMYYDLDNMSQLADKIGVSQPTISKWKARNSIIPVKKICRELGIYNEIFGDLNSNVNNFHNSNINKAFDYSENSHSQDSFNINNTPLYEKITKMNQTIVSSFIAAYDTLEKKGDLKKLYEILGEIQFGKK